MHPLWDEGKEWIQVCCHIHIQLMKNEATEYTDICDLAFKQLKKTAYLFMSCIAFITIE